MKIFYLTLKDLSQMFRDKRSLLFIVAMPIVFTLFMGFAYRSSVQPAQKDSRIRLALADSQPEARLNKMLTERLQASDAIKLVAMPEAEAMAAFRKGEVAGVLIIPAGFSDQAEVGNEAQLTLIAEAASAQGQSLYQLLRVPVSNLMSAVETARISADVQADPAEFGPSLELAWSKWNANSKVQLVQVEQAVARPVSDWTGGNPYNQASPGILVMFAIFGLMTSAQIVVQERKNGTIQRLMTTAMRPAEIVAGHLLAMFALTFFQTMMLVIFGQLVLGVEYASAPLGVLLVSVTLGLWVAALGLLIGVLAHTEDQVVLYSMVAMFMFSALGGTWFPLESAGSGFSALGRLMPSAWAMTGLQNILIRGLDSTSAFLPAGVIFAYALGFFVLAVWRFRKMI